MAFPKPLPVTQTHFFSRLMSDNAEQGQEDSLQLKQQLNGTLIPELDPDVIITTTPGRRKWTALETADLIDGCVKVGVCHSSLRSLLVLSNNRVI